MMFRAMRKYLSRNEIWVNYWCESTRR